MHHKALGGFVQRSLKRKWEFYWLIFKNIKYKKIQALYILKRNSNEEKLTIISSLMIILLIMA